MKHNGTIAAAAALSLALLAGCVPPSVPADLSGSAQSAQSGSTVNTPEEQKNILYDCGGLVVAIPAEYQDLLVIRQNDIAYGASTLLSVYEKASVEDAESAGLEDADQMGWLFSVVRCGPDQYREAMAADIPGLDLFAKDQDWYYGWATPTDVRIYRRGDITEKDSAAWEKVQQVSDLVKADFRTRNDLLPTLKDSAQGGEHAFSLTSAMQTIAPGDITSLALLGSSDPVQLTKAIHSAVEHPTGQTTLEDACWRLNLLLEGGPEVWTSADLRMELICGLKEDLVEVSVLRDESRESAVFESPELYQMVRHSFDTEPVIDQQAARSFRYILEPRMKMALEKLQATADCYTGYELTRFTPVFSFVEDSSGVQRVTLYDFDFVILTDDPSKIVWAGGMHLDGDLRVHGANAAGQLAIRSVNKELTDTAFMGSSFHFVPDLPQDQLEEAMKTIQAQLDGQD